MGPRATKSNIYDVAARAGVSHQTVSRVINNHASVREATRQRVLDAMQALEYVPNLAARTLVTAKTGLIGILASDTTLYGPAGGVNAMEIEARRAGYMTITRTINPDSEEETRLGVQHLRLLGVEGIIVITTHNRPAIIARELAPHIPVVGIDAEYSADELSVEVDNVDAASRATQHLIDLGHTDILHISGPEASFVGKHRVLGYTDTMRRARLRPRVEVGDWSIVMGYRVGAAFDFAKEQVTAVFCANDSLALGLLKACRERAIAVPAQLSVVGFDDIPEAEYFDPPLTTMRQEFADIGHTAMTLLLRRLAGETNLESEFVKLEFKVRGSTASVPKIASGLSNRDHPALPTLNL
jgi:DNA-binding LacI/PurR family transcriptional regulator